MMLLAEGFMIGVIAAASFTVGVLFLKYWLRSGDQLFLAFGAAFLIEAVNRATLLFMANPSEGNPWFFMARLLSFLIILAGILRKNYGRR